MLHAGLDLSRNRLVCLLSDQGEIVEEFKSPADRDGLSGLVRRVNRHRQPVRAAIESMTAAGARYGRVPSVRLDGEGMSASSAQASVFTSGARARRGVPPRVGR